MPATSATPEVAASSNADASQNVSATDRVVLDYLRSRGFHAAESSLLKDIGASSPDDKGKQPETSVTADDFVKRLEVSLDAKSGGSSLKDAATVLQSLRTLSSPTNIQNLLSTIGAVGAEEILSLDPTDKHEGFRELESWVDGSLDMYRVRTQFLKSRT
jgi:transcription initiation factor TFIID subunit 5